LRLLVGFTLVLASPHYELRKQLMEEANTVGTTSLRSGMLPQAQRSQIACFFCNMFKRAVNTRSRRPASRNWRLR
jgi:hypothetical protein